MWTSAQASMGLDGENGELLSEKPARAAAHGVTGC